MTCRIVSVLAHCLFITYAVAAQEQPDLQRVLAAGERTLEQVETSPTTWTTVLETPGNLRAHVKILSSPPMRRIEIGLQGNGRHHRLVDIIERDNRWYLESQGKREVYRPYEFPAQFPGIYLFLARSDVTVLGDAQQEMEFVELKGDVATYRVPLPGQHQQDLAATLENMNELVRQNPERADDNVKQTIRRIQDMLDNGTATAINVRTGIIELNGAAGQRCWIEDFQLLDDVPTDTFEVAKHQWADRTSSVFEPNRSRENVVMIGNSPQWRPGLPAGETDVLLMNINTGQTRRLPYTFGIASAGCFSADRSRVYVCGHVPELGSLSIFEIELDSGHHRLLGGPDLQTGVTMFPVISPDGQFLAAIHLDPAHGPLSSQVHIIEIESGQSRPIGEPFDTAFCSWLPDGSGLILVSRKHEKLDEPAISTICRMDLNGQITPIRNGGSPVLIHRGTRILFDDAREGRLWKTCDLRGENVEMFGDGLKQFGFATASPNGDRLIMMKFGGPRGPIPHVIDATTGTAKALTVGPGLWATPCWR